jgi:hypothetical protein
MITKLERRFCSASHVLHSSTAAGQLFGPFYKYSNPIHVFLRFEGSSRFVNHVPRYCDRERLYKQTRALSNIKHHMAACVITGRPAEDTKTTKTVVEHRGAGRIAIASSSGAPPPRPKRQERTDATRSRTSDTHAQHSTPQRALPVQATEQ